MKLDIVILGLSITSSWGNGHASTYRALAKGLAGRGHTVTFLERDVPWYRAHSDPVQPLHCATKLYGSLKELSRNFGPLIERADLVILGSYVPDGAAIAGWLTTRAHGVCAFYDIDTPVTLAGLRHNRIDYITAAMIPRFHLYLSFTGGPALRQIENVYGSPCARALHCGVDADLHRPVSAPLRYDIGYLGTYSADRQVGLERLLLHPARAMPERHVVVVGAQYPSDITWPPNVHRGEHLAPEAHAEFYCAQRFTLNLTRAEMLTLGFSPSVRLFEAAACGVPIISDRWPGLEEFFLPDAEILIADRPEQVIDLVRNMSEIQRRDIALAARKRVLSTHTADDRAKVLEQYYREVVGRNRTKRRTASGAPIPTERIKARTGCTLDKPAAMRLAGAKEEFPR